MATALQQHPSSGQEKSVLPVFPVENTVLFPRTVIPLRVFEPRYVALLQDAQEAAGLIVIALKTGADFKRIGTVGSLRNSRPLEDGSFEIQLMGMSRVSLQPRFSEKPYDQARVLTRPEGTGTSDRAVIEEARLEILASYGMLRSILRGNEPLVRHQDLPFEVAVNTASAGLPVEASLRQLLLQEDTILGRQRLAVELMSTVTDALSWLKVLKGNSSTMTN